MSKKKKKHSKLNQAIRHYFGDEGFDEGIVRVDTATLTELAHTLGIIPDSWEKEELVRTFRRLWSDADIDIRQHIVAFFKAEGKLYLSDKPKEPAIERTEKIASILETMDVTKEEALLLHNAFIDIRTKKITPEKMASKLEHIRHEQKRAALEKKLDGHFDYEDRLEFNAVLSYNVLNATFKKIQPLKTSAFSYTYLDEGESEQLFKEISDAKEKMIAQKQQQLDAFLQTLDAHHPYLTPEQIVNALKSAPPGDAIDATDLSDELLLSVLNRDTAVEAVEQSAYDVILTVYTDMRLPFQEKTYPYRLTLTLPKERLVRSLWYGKPLGVKESVLGEKTRYERMFISELEHLVAECREHAKLLNFGDEELYEMVYTHLLAQLGDTLHITHKLTKKILYKFNQDIQQAVLKRQRQELLGRTIRDFKNLFPLAREMRRRLIFHVGPTNSGKTYQAMQALKNADTGYYLAPLRLLALEGYEGLKEMGIESSLVTGEEQIMSDEATHISSTIEMLNFEVDVDVCVIDEVQMLGDRDRGWAWANAIIGAPAKTIIMTGSPNAKEAVTALAEYLGEPLEIIEFERKNPLELMHRATPLSEIRPGTAVIAFSRKDVLRLKQQLSRNYSVSVVYGNLSPEVRREEARRFREGETELLIATDAIAMGLNLPIQTILFSRGDKFDGEQQRELLPSEIHQISGRAGRYGLHEKGFVGALKPDVLQVLQKHYHKPAKPITIPFSVMANLEHIKLVGSILEEESLSEILHFFVKNMQFDGPFRAANLETMDEAAAIVDHYRLDLPTKFHLACAPISTQSPYIVSAYERYIRALEQHKPVAYIPPSDLPDFAQTMEQLRDAEDRVKEISLYLWLSYRFAEYFVDAEKARNTRGILNRFIENSLKQSHFVPRCRLCTKPLPLNSQYNICQSCFNRQYKSGQRAAPRSDGSRSRGSRK